MEKDYQLFDLPVLRSMLAREEREFSRALLRGASWTDVQDQKRRITELSIAIHHRLHPVTTTHPAEFITRKNASGESASQ